MRKALLPLAFVAALPVTSLGAQGLGDGSVIVNPQIVNYKFGTGSAAKTVTQLSSPFVLIVPFGDRFNVDISTSYASTEVKVGSAVTSKISGLTDTQIRGNITIGDNAAIFTIGVNLPTGKYTVPEAQQEAAGQIGNDFLLYPVSSMGNGLGATGGIAFAQSAGDWNLGFGGSFRHSTQFDAYKVASSVLRFTPGDEFRARVGADRPVGDGRLSLAVTYSKFGNDRADSTTSSTGDRALGQASLTLPMGNGDITIVGWDLYRASGQILSGPSPWANVGNLNLAVGFRLGDVYVQPSAEGRSWNVGGNKAGLLGNFGLRFRFTMGDLSINPSAGYSVGTLYSTISGGGTTDVTGYRASILIRLR
jgi:hypothetical protein